MRICFGIFLLIASLLSAEGPDFLILGAQKAGTTALWKYLKKHPSILPAAKKELHYYDNHYDQGIEWYLSQFPDTDLVTFEATPIYLFYSDIPERVAQDFPNIPLVIILRDPVERAFSQYRMNVRKEKETRTFDQIIDEELESLDEVMSYPIRKWKLYLSRGIYLPQIQRWLEYFPKEQILILFSNDLKKQTDLTMHKIYEFVGIPSDHRDQYILENQSQSDDGLVLRGDQRERLEKFYAPYNQALREFLMEKFDLDLNF